MESIIRDHHVYKEVWDRLWIYFHGIVLLRIATETRNSWKFLPVKQSHYKVHPWLHTCIYKCRLCTLGDCQGKKTEASLTPTMPQTQHSFGKTASECQGHSDLCNVFTCNMVLAMYIITTACAVYVIM